MKTLQEKAGAPRYLAASARFAFDDLVVFQARGKRPFEDVAADIDLILTGPHASAVFPQELASFIDPNLTERLQYDYSDVATDAFAIAWAQADPRVVYIRNPVSRLVFDQNRARPTDAEGDLREIFRRISRKAAGDNAVTFAGVDAIRPVTFANHPVLTEPPDDVGYARLMGVLTEAASRTSWAYADARDRVIETVAEAKIAAFATLDPMRMTVSEWHAATTMHVQCVHDTMNATASADGAVALAKAPAAKLPMLVSIANRGDLDGNLRPGTQDAPMPEANLLTMRPADLRAIADALQKAFGIPDNERHAHVVLNTPYQGAAEVQAIGQRLRDIAELSVTRHADLPQTLKLATGAYQAEYLRETLLGEANTGYIQQPGTDWITPDNTAVDTLVAGVCKAQSILRACGPQS